MLVTIIEDMRPFILSKPLWLASSKAFFFSVPGATYLARFLELQFC